MSVPSRIAALAIGAALFAAAVPVFAQAKNASSGAAPGAGQGDIASRRADLDDLKKRIGALQKEMSRTEADRSGAATALAQSERAVSVAQRELRRLEQQRSQTETTLAQLESEQRATGKRIEERRAELAAWLRHYYIAGGAEPVAPLLAAGDPNQIARDAHYLEHLGRARLALIDGLRADLRDTERRANEIQARRDRVVALEGEQRERRSELQARQQERKQALAELSRQLQTQKKEVASLRSDEQRLGKVIDTLVQRAREAAAREAARKAAERRAAERRAAQEKAARERAAAAQARSRAPAQSRAGAVTPPPSTSKPAATPRTEPVLGQARAAAGPTPTGVRFAQLRGQLRFPVRGELVGRFGAPRSEGGTTWKGVFIRAVAGGDVRAVAAGDVVFSDWLRGYGNLIIVDHGSDYLSVYGNNDALLKEVGDGVGGGEPIASVGSSGGGQESGLYFEIRHQGRPLDPMQWVRLN